MRYKVDAGPIPKIRGCSEKELLAIDDYMTNGYKQKQALRAAGYTGHSGYIFKKKHIRAEIQLRMEKNEADRNKAMGRIKRKNTITKERLINEYARIAFAPLSRGRIVVEDEDGKLETCELIQVTQDQIDIGADIPVDARDKKTALDSLAKLEGLFIDQLNITGEKEIVQNLIDGRMRAAAQKQLPEDTGGEFEEAEVVE